MLHAISDHGITLVYPIMMFFALIAGAYGFYLVLKDTIRQLGDQEALEIYPEDGAGQEEEHHGKV